MPVRKETIRGKALEAIRPVLQPGEQEVAGFAAMTGMSPWLLGGLIQFAFRKFYFVQLTDRRVIFLRLSASASRPQGIDLAEPRNPQSVVAARVRPLWSVLRYRREDGKATRLNVARIWRADLEGFLSAMQAPAASPGAAPAPPVPPPPGFTT